MSSSAFAEGQTSRMGQMGQTGLRERPSGEVAACGEPTFVGCFFSGGERKDSRPGGSGVFGEGAMISH